MEISLENLYVDTNLKCRERERKRKRKVGDRLAELNEKRVTES